MIKNRPSIPAPKKTRGAKEMAESDKIPQIDPTEIEILIQKIEQNKLDERERRLIVALLRTFLYIVAQLQEKKITLLKIKDMIIGRKSDKNKKEKEKAGKGRAHCRTAYGDVSRPRHTIDRTRISTRWRTAHTSNDGLHSSLCHSCGSYRAPLRTAYS